MINSPLSCGIQDPFYNFMFSQLSLSDVKKCGQLNKEWNNVCKIYIQDKCLNITLPIFFNFNDHPLEKYQNLQDLTVYHLPPQSVILKDKLSLKNFTLKPIQEIIFPKQFKKKYPHNFGIQVPQVQINFPCEKIDIEQLNLSDDPLIISDYTLLKELHIRSIIPHYPRFDLQSKISLIGIFPDEFIHTPPLLEKLTLCEFSINDQFIEFIKKQSLCKEIHLDFFNHTLDYNQLFETLENLYYDHALEKIHLGILSNSTFEDPQFIRTAPNPELPITSAKIELCQYHFLANFIPSLSNLEELEIIWPLISDIFGIEDIQERIIDWFSYLKNLHTVSIHLPLGENAQILINTIPNIKHVTFGVNCSHEPIYRKNYFWQQLKLINQQHPFLESTKLIFSKQSLPHDDDYIELYVFNNEQITTLNMMPNLSLEIHEQINFDFTILQYLETLNNLSLFCSQYNEHNKISLDYAIESACLNPFIKFLSITSGSASPSYYIENPLEIFNDLNNSTIKELYFDFPLGLNISDFIDCCCILDNVTKLTFSFPIEKSLINKLRLLTGAVVICKSFIENNP